MKQARVTTALGACAVTLAALTASTARPEAHAGAEAAAPEGSWKMTPKQASGFARLALKAVVREYPNKPGEVLNGPADVRGPRAMHPAFYGSFDWHSSV